MQRGSDHRRSRSTDRRSGLSSYGGTMKRSSSVDRLSVYGRSSSSGRQSIAPLRVRNDVGNPKVKTSARPSNDGRSSFGWKQSSVSSSLGSRKTPQKSRASLYSRASGVGLSSHNGIPKDPRKLTDKGLQQKFIRNILEFLIDRGYGHQITTKILSCPTTKDFLKIFEFIYSHFEPKFKLGKKPEEEVPILLKSLRYPFLISRSSIFAVGTSHTWPSLLAALDWMVNLIKSTENAVVDDVLFLNNDSFDDMPEAKIKCDYFERTYEAFLDGYDTFEDYDAKLAQMFSQKSFGIHGNVENLEDNTKRLEIEYENLVKDIERLRSQQVKLAASVADEQTYNQYVENLMTHERNMQTQYDTLQEEHVNLCLEQEEIQSRIRQMQQIYDTQEFTPADITRINLERQELRRKKESAERQSSEYDEEIWNYEKEMAKILDKVESKCSEYNKRARKLNMIPDTAENAFGVDYELSYSSSSYESTKFQNVIKPALNELRNRFGESIRQKEIERIENTNFMEQVKEHNDEIISEIDMNETKLKRMDEEYDVRKQICQREYQKSKDTIDYLQKSQWECRAAEQQTVEETEQELWESAKQGRYKLEQKIKERRQYEIFLETVTKKIIDHRLSLTSQIEKLQKESVTELEKVEKETLSLKQL